MVLCHWVGTYFSWGGQDWEEEIDFTPYSVSASLPEVKNEGFYKTTEFSFVGFCLMQDSTIMILLSSSRHNFLFLFCHIEMLHLSPVWALQQRYYHFHTHQTMFLWTQAAVLHSEWCPRFHKVYLFKSIYVWSVNFRWTIVLLDIIFLNRYHCLQLWCSTCCHYSHEQTSLDRSK